MCVCGNDVSGKYDRTANTATVLLFLTLFEESHASKATPLARDKREKKKWRNEKGEEEERRERGEKEK